MVIKPASSLQSEDMPKKATGSNREKLGVSTAAMQIFDQMQDANFADGAAKFLAMSAKELGEAANKTASVG